MALAPRTRPPCVEGLRAMQRKKEAAGGLLRVVQDLHGPIASVWDDQGGSWRRDPETGKDVYDGSGRASRMPEARKSAADYSDIDPDVLESLKRDMGF